MKPIRVQNRLTSLAIAIMLLALISPVRAVGAPTGEDHNRRHLEVTFTKWFTAYPAMAGIVGGDVSGVFVGEVLDRKPSTNPLLTSGMTRLEAIYEIQAGARSFTALIEGGENNATGAAVLDGVILAGWRTDDLVHVKFQQKTNCLGAPAGVCFQGTIRIARASEE